MVKKSASTVVESKIPDISGLAANLVLTAVETEIPDVSSLITRVHFDATLKAISDRVTKNFFVENEVKRIKSI